MRPGPPGPALGPLLRRREPGPGAGRPRPGPLVPPGHAAQGPPPGAPSLGMDTGVRFLHAGRLRQFDPHWSEGRRAAGHRLPPELMLRLLRIGAGCEWLDLLFWSYVLTPS